MFSIKHLTYNVKKKLVIRKRVVTDMAENFISKNYRPPYRSNKMSLKTMIDNSTKT